MKQRGLLLLGIAFTVAACSAGCAEVNDSAIRTSTGPSQVEPPVGGNVRVTLVRVFIKDGHVQAFVQGELGDGCTFLESVRQQRTDNSIHIALTSVRTGDVCTMIFQYLNEWVRLEGPFAPGEYTVRANAATAQFRLVRAAGGDLRVDPDPGPLPQPPYLPASSPQHP